MRPRPLPLQHRQMTTPRGRAQGGTYTRPTDKAGSWSLERAYSHCSHRQMTIPRRRRLRQTSPRGSRAPTRHCTAPPQREECGGLPVVRRCSVSHLLRKECHALAANI
eukprot:scaffold9052_cov107-Isochrysis_galbana.AAC.8